MANGLELLVTRELYSVSRLAADAPLPAWARSGFVSVTRTASELSLVTPEACVPDGIESEAGWRLLEVAGPLDFSQIGVLASLATPLASASLSLLAISTFSTDYLLVRSSDLARAVAALEEAGHVVAQAVAPGETAAGSGTP